MARVKPIPLEAQPYALVTAILAVIFFAALIRLWLLRRVENKLLKNRDVLEKQVLTQQREVLATRSDSHEWRAEMKRQFDGFRAMASDQLTVEEKRFEDLLKRSELRQSEMQASLDVARKMCAELPAAKARVMQLEQALGIDGEEGLSETEAGDELSPMPELGEGATNGRGQWDFSAPILTMPVSDEDRVAELERNLASARQEIVALQKALTVARLKSRMKPKNGRAKATR